jgi:hypothetical protein
MGLENVSIYVKELDSGITLYTYASKQIRHLNSIEESRRAVIADSQAFKVRYGAYRGNYDVLEVWIVRVNKLYTIRCMAKPSYFSGYLTIYEIRL